VGGSQGLVEVGAGFLQTQDLVTSSPSPHPGLFLASQTWDSPGELERESSVVGSAGDGPKNGARLMVPMASSGEPRSWQEGQAVSR
jgi:hypothetical protein